MLTSRTNGNTIFLPAAGYLDAEAPDTDGRTGCYWTASIEQYNDEQACSMNFNLGNSDYVTLGYSQRKHGLPVRPVLRK